MVPPICFDIILFLLNNKYSKIEKILKFYEKTTGYIQYGNKRIQLWRL